MGISLRRPAFAAILAASAVSLVCTPPAQADFPTGPGLGSVLTSSTSATDPGIHFLGGPTVQPRYCTASCTAVEVRSAMWAPDGSRAVFETQGRIATVRSDDYDSVEYMAGAAHHSDEDPAYRSDGSIVFTRLEGAGCQLMLSSGLPDSEFSVSPADGACWGFPNGGPDGQVVLQRGSGSTTDIWLWDGQGAGAAHFKKIITDGMVPSLSPDGTKVAFSRLGDLWIAGVDGSGATMLYHDPTYSVQAPVFSPDGNTIAFYRFSDDVLTVPATGGSVAVSGLKGMPAYRTEQTDHALRLAGGNRFGTATAVSGAYWATAGDASDDRPAAEAVVLSRSDTFADALGGSALAAAKHGPLLLTPPTSLNADTAGEIQRVLGSNHSATVYILGGTGAISAGVQARIEDLGYATSRISGDNRYDTAVKIATAISSSPQLILAATGANFPDALAAGAAAGSFNSGGTGGPAVVILTNDRVLPQVTKNYLNAHVSATVPVVGIGGQAAQAVSVYGANAGALVGGNRYETAEFVAEVFFGGNAFAGIATGTDWPDALSGGALLGTLNAPLLLSAGTLSHLQPPTAWNLSLTAPAVSGVLVFGGTGVVAQVQLAEAAGLISGPAGYVVESTAPAAVGSRVAAVRSTSRLRMTASAGHRTVRQIMAAVRDGRTTN